MYRDGRRRRDRGDLRWRLRLWHAVLAVVLAGCRREEPGPIAIIPAPLRVEALGGVGRSDDVTLLLDESLGPDGYVLDVDRHGVAIVAGDAAGVFYARQTLAQLGDPPPAVHIVDRPRFAWRGLMLDVARHFMTVDEVKRQIDAMALHKLNRLHLHLTDDQGWRIEITSWPLLTEVGASTEVGGGPGGYYTQADYAEIVAYADDRFIVVVPEIDMPGHCNAAEVAYPELSPGGAAPEAYTGTGPYSQPLGIDEIATDAFVRDVFGEVAALTPGPWVHFGGDEALGLDDEAYDAFVADVVSVIADEGKEPIGWDEAAGAPPIVQWWIDEERAATASLAGAQIIASPAEHAYFDMVHDADAQYGQIWAGPTSVQDAYEWDPGRMLGDPNMVIGVEGALWTELIATPEQVDFMLWPRSAALAEVGWSQESDWEDFRERLAADGERLDALGIGFYRTPEVDW